VSFGLVGGFVYAICSWRRLFHYHNVYKKASETNILSIIDFFAKQ
jgi:hypothetical protein